jgi:hypothetical protein
MERKGANCLFDNFSEEKLSIAEIATGIKEYDTFLILRTEKSTDAERCAKELQLL